MAAFDKICSGYPQMDEILDFIRLGDNVVWQVDSVSDYRKVVEPYLQRARQDQERSTISDSEAMSR